MKIVVNRSKGERCGYKLSQEACKMLNVTDPYAFFLQEDRNNLELVRVVELLQEKANGDIADLRVIEIPDELETKDEEGRRIRRWHITETTGFEVIRENHRFW